MLFIVKVLRVNEDVSEDRFNSTSMTKVTYRLRRLYD